MANAPAGVVYAQHISTRLAEAIAGHTKTDVARQTGVSRQAVYDILTGVTFPDSVSLAKLETALKVRLWPGPDDLQ
jgi:transcriptional regulator with XRE-family HTH domain